MAVIDLRMKPAWVQTGDNFKRFYYQGLPFMTQSCYTRGVSGPTDTVRTNTTKYYPTMVGMKPLDCEGYDTAHVSTYNFMNTIGHFTTQTSITNLKVGDYGYICSEAADRNKRNLKVRILKVITDLRAGGSNPCVASDGSTPEFTVVFELLVAAHGWPLPQHNGDGRGYHNPVPKTYEGYRMDCISAGAAGSTVFSRTDMTTYSLVGLSAGTDYWAHSSTARTLPITDRNGSNLMDNFSADELKYWGNGGEGDMAPQILEVFPQTYSLHYGDSEAATHDTLGTELDTITLSPDRPNDENTQPYASWGFNWVYGYPHALHADNVRARRMDGIGPQVPYLYAGESSYTSDSGTLRTYKRWITPVGGTLKDPPKGMVITFSPKWASTYMDALLAESQINFSGQPSDGDTVTITDDESVVKVFEFDSGGGVTGDNIAVTIGADAAATAVNLKVAINAAGFDDDFRVKARASNEDSSFTPHPGDYSGGTTVNVRALYMGLTTNFTVAESAANVTVKNLWAGTDGGGFRITSSASTTTVPGGYTRTPYHCYDMVITLTNSGAK